MARTFCRDVMLLSGFRCFAHYYCLVHFGRRFVLTRFFFFFSAIMYKINCLNRHRLRGCSF